MDFRDRVGELAVPAWKELLDQGAIENYARFEVLVPRGAAAPYDVIALVQFKNKEAFDAATGLFGAKLREMFPHRNVPQEAMELRYPMVQELLTVDELEIGFIPVGFEKHVIVLELIKVEAKAAKAHHEAVLEFMFPAQQRLVEQGFIEAHSRFHLSEPMKSSMDANYLTLSRFRDASAWAGFRESFMQTERELFPSRNLEAEYSKHCEVIRTELVYVSHAVSGVTR